MYEMHRNYQDCPPPAPAFCSCTTRNAMCSATLRPPLVCLMRPTPRTSPQMRYTAPGTLPRPCPQHQAPAHRSHPQRSLRASARTCTHHSWDVRHQRRAAPVASIPRPIRRFPRLCPRWLLRHCSTLPPRRRPLSTRALGRISITAPTPPGSSRHAPRVITAKFDVRVHLRAQHPVCAHR
jgi:hypothetical protein